MRWTTMFRPVSRFENAKLEELWQAKRNDKLNTFDLGFVLIFAVPTLIVVVKALQVPQILTTCARVQKSASLWFKLLW